VPPSVRDQLVLGEAVESEARVFELYLPGAMPADAVVLATVTVDRVFAISDARVDHVAIDGIGERAIDGDLTDPQIR